MVLNALDEVLFWDNIPLLKDFINENTRKYYPHDSEKYYSEKNAFLMEHIPDKSAFESKLLTYIQNGSPTWISGRNGMSDDIGASTLRKAIRVSSRTENGQKKANIASEWQKRNPLFWQFYSDNVLYRDCNCVLELTIGAGGGTNAVMSCMSEQDDYIGVDLDFICAKNADAMAKHYGINGLGIATSLWHLPFEEGMFTSVCCNAGLEECREIPKILSEAVRVLAPNGRIIIHCLRKEKVLWYSYFEEYGFTMREAQDWLRKVRLFSDIEQVKELLAANGLTLIEQVEDAVLGYIIVFEK